MSSEGPSSTSAAPDAAGVKLDELGVLSSERIFASVRHRARALLAGARPQYRRIIGGYCAIPTSRWLPIARGQSP
jgi:hypothetical protein